MASTAVPCHFQPRRGKARLRLGIPANLITVHGRHRVTLLDLSESGARLQYDGDRISDAVLEWLGYEVFASVVRRSGHDLGLQFDEPIETAWVLQTRDRLPEIAQAEDQVSRFAREWARGLDSRSDTARAPGWQAGRLRYRGSITEARSRTRGQTSAVRSWFRAARPYLLGGVVVGLVAGYGACFL